MNTSLLHTLSGNRGWILFRSLLAILFGLLAVAWPGLTLVTLGILYGAYAIAFGLRLTGPALRLRQHTGASAA